MAAKGADVSASPNSGNGPAAGAPGPRESAPRRKVTVQTLAEKYRHGEPITVVTAYDYPGAVAVEEAGLDVILVGDSLGMVVLGYDSTLPVTMADMLHHARAVRRGAEHPLLIGDMPFLSYQADPAEAVRNAGRFLAEAGMDAVKLEGGAEMAPTVAAIVAAGIPVMGHIGLTPQHVRRMGGYRVQGKTAEEARVLLVSARALAEAGCFSIVLESIPAEVAAWITAEISIPTIGIGAGAGTSGQVLVFHDLLGYFDRFTPKFVKRYANLHPTIVGALRDFKADVETHRFPAAEHAVAMDPEERQRLAAAPRRQHAPRH
jgi:3-methyl-2-oxobutanoate hydroxymethyltransferase